VNRPYPPERVLEPSNSPVFVAAPELERWMRETFIETNATLCNEDHQYLQSAHIGCLWTNVENSRHQNRIVGTAELGQPKPGQGKWARARQEYQTLEWFGAIPDFIITLYAEYAVVIPDIDFCSTSEHELYHCHVQYKNGSPRFQKNGKPFWAIRGHDAEEHVGIVRRYGAAAGAGRTFDLVQAAQRPPEIGLASVARACGRSTIKSWSRPYS
jgi:hypothetical protein